MNRGVVAVVLVALACASLGIAACFPDYAIGAAAAGGDLDGTTSDAPTGDSTTSDAPTGDGTTADASGGDGGVADTGTTTGDSSATDPIVQIEGGTFAFQVMTTGGSVVDAQASLGYTLAIDKYEVTVGRFQAWLDAGMPIPAGNTQLDNGYPAMVWSSPAWDGPAKDTHYNDGSSSYCNGPGGAGIGPTYNKGNPSLPMNCVTWEQALAVCWWDHGRRLPTDTEWRIVASSEGRRHVYPWGGQTPTDCTLTIWDNDGVTYCSWPVAAGSTAAGQTLDGVFDIVGSLSEWLWDDVPGSSYSYPAQAGTNYPGPTPTGTNHRIYIGGDWATNDWSVFKVDQAAPTGSGPEENFDNTGFRCATSAP